MLHAISSNAPIHSAPSSQATTVVKDASAASSQAIQDILSISHQGQAASAKLDADGDGDGH